MQHQDSVRRRIALMILLLSVHAVFFLIALTYKKIYNGDSFEYIYAAVNLKDRAFFYSGNPAMQIEPEYMTFRTPVYPLFLAAIYSITINNWLVLIVQNLISVGNIMLTRSMLFRFGYNKRYDWLFLIFLLAWPTQFVHANIIEPEILLQSTVLLYLHQLLRLYYDKKIKYAWGMNIALAAGLLVKPVLYPYTIVHLLLMLVLIFRDRGLQKTAVMQVGLALIPLLTIIGYNSWNQQRTGKFHFTSNQSFNAIFYFYYYKSAKEGIPAARSFLEEERSKMAAIPEFKLRYDYANKRGKELLKEHAADYIPYHLKHSLRFFIDPGKGDLELFTGGLTYGQLYSDQTKGLRQYISENGWLRGIILFSRQQPTIWFLIPIVVFNIIKLGGLAIWFRQKTTSFGISLFLIMFIGYFALITGPISTPRYALPIALVLTGGATLGGMAVLQKQRQSKYSETV